jgi:hypothetical protein
MKKETLTPNAKFADKDLVHLNNIDSELSKMQILTDRFCNTMRADLNKMSAILKQMSATIDEIKKL